MVNILLEVVAVLTVALTIEHVSVLVDGLYVNGVVVSSTNKGLVPADTLLNGI